MAVAQRDFWHCHVCLFLDVVRTSLSLLSPLVSAFNSAVQDGLAEAVISCAVAKICHLTTHTSGEERFLSAYEMFELVLYIISGFVPSVGDAKELSETFFL